MRLIRKQFVLEKETPGAVRYRELDKDRKPIDDFKVGDAVVGVLYIRKNSLNGQIPPLVTVTIEEGGND